MNSAARLTGIAAALGASNQARGGDSFCLQRGSFALTFGLIVIAAAGICTAGIQLGLAMYNSERRQNAVDACALFVASYLRDDEQGGSAEQIQRLADGVLNEHGIDGRVSCKIVDSEGRRLPVSCRLEGDDSYSQVTTSLAQISEDHPFQQWPVTMLVVDTSEGMRDLWRPEKTELGRAQLEIPSTPSQQRRAGVRQAIQQLLRNPRPVRLGLVAFDQNIVGTVEPPAGKEPAIAAFSAVLDRVRHRGTADIARALRKTAELLDRVDADTPRSAMLLLAMHPGSGLSVTGQYRWLITQRAAAQSAGRALRNLDPGPGVDLHSFLVYGPSAWRKWLAGCSAFGGVFSYCGLLEAISGPARSPGGDPSFQHKVKHDADLMIEMLRKLNNNLCQWKLPDTAKHPLSVFEVSGGERSLLTGEHYNFDPRSRMIRLAQPYCTKLGRRPELHLTVRWGQAQLATEPSR